MSLGGVTFDVHTLLFASLLRMITLLATAPLSASTLETAG